MRRLAGPDRYATAAAISAEAFSAGADVAYAAIGTNFPDAVAAGPAAAHLGGPLLLMRADSATGHTVAELRRLGVTVVNVVGAEWIIGDEALDDLEGIGTGGQTVRVDDLPRP